VEARDDFKLIVEVNQSDPLSLHKYVYAANNPVNNIDPLGLFTQQLGYLAEDAIGQIYARDHVGDKVLYGGWTRLGGVGNVAYRLKPDIFNMTTKRWAEIKPLTYSGLAKAECNTLPIWRHFGTSATGPIRDGNPRLTTRMPGTSNPVLQRWRHRVLHQRSRYGGGRDRNRHNSSSQTAFD
jgi:hypothetical protein